MTINFYRPGFFYRLTPAGVLRAGVMQLMLMLVMCWGDAMAGLGKSPLPISSPQLAQPSQPSQSSQTSQTSRSESGARILASPRPTSYTVHESALESGTTIKEYATAAGVVFAVQWRGPVLPELDDLLGAYFVTFRAEAQKSRAAGRRGSPMTVATDTLIVNSTGRMRNFAGWAYAPGLIPADVNIKDVFQ